jgi:hypothetical protein
MGSTHPPHRHARGRDVLLDIGQDVGALVLYTGSERRGAEIEVSLRAPGSRRVHTEIRERRVNGRLLYAGVYPELPAGEYVVWDEDGPAAEFIVRGGKVSELNTVLTLPPPGGLRPPALPPRAAGGIWG